MITRGVMRLSMPFSTSCRTNDLGYFWHLTRTLPNVMPYPRVAAGSFLLKEVRMHFCKQSILMIMRLSSLRPLDMFVSNPQCSTLALEGPDEMRARNNGRTEHQRIYSGPREPRWYKKRCQVCQDVGIPSLFSISTCSGLFVLYRCRPPLCRLRHVLPLNQLC